jgi:hypothetical protein
MAIVTGHESICERSMAEHPALSKSAHSALSPVSVTERRAGPTSRAVRSASRPRRSWRWDPTPPRRSRLPCGRRATRTRRARGSETVDTSRLACSVRATPATTCCALGSADISAVVVDHDDLKGGRAEGGRSFADKGRRRSTSPTRPVPRRYTRSPRPLPRSAGPVTNGRTCF